MAKDWCLLLYISIQMCVVLSTTEDEKKSVLHILVTAPYPNLLNIGWDEGISLVPAVRLAVEEINNHSEYLQNYTLKLIEVDAGCRSSTSVPLKAFPSFVSGAYYNQLQGEANKKYITEHGKNRNIVGIIGPACSDTALYVAPLLARPEVNLLQIAPTVTSPMIETQNFTTTFTMISSSLSYIKSISMLMDCYGWSKVAILFDGQGDIFRTTYDKFVENLSDKVGYVSPVYMETYDHQDAFLSFPLNELKETQLRVIIVFAGKSTVQRILCLAYHFDMAYPRYQWIFSERSADNFKEDVKNFIYEDNQYSCSKTEMTQVANGSILNEYSLTLEDSAKISVTSHNYSTYRNQYRGIFDQHSKEHKVKEILAEANRTIDDYQPPGSWENTYYDAGWALGLALHDLSEDGHNLTAGKPGASNFTQLLSEKLLHVSFIGATGNVKFSHSTRSVLTTILINQLQATNLSGFDELLLTKYDTSRMPACPNGSSISDRFEEVPQQIRKSIGIIVILITVAIAILLVLLHLAFMAWNNFRCIKAVSPNISHQIFSGCYIFLLGTIVHTIQEAFLTRFELVYPVLCSTVMWCLMIGSSLILGAIFVQVWRIFRLFKHFRNRSPGILLEDRALVCSILVFVTIDVVICLFWIVYNPWELEKIILPVESSLLLMIRHSCTCQNIEYWIAGVAVYKGGIALALVTFSVLNRKIRRRHFSHTKKVNILVYSLTVLGSVGFPLYFLLKNYTVYLSYLIICVFFLMAVVLCCVLIFLPPVVSVLKLKYGIDEEVRVSQHLRRKFSVSLGITNSLDVL